MTELASVKNKDTLAMPNNHVGQEPERQGNARRQRAFADALQVIAVLQTSLDIDELMRLFFKEAASILAISSVHLTNTIASLDILEGEPATSSCSYHLQIEDCYLGEFMITRDRALDAEELLILEYLLSALVYPLRNGLLYRNAHAASLTDSLTGVNNRCALDKALHHEISLTFRNDTPLSFILLDVDFFKNVNDEHGHLVGDFVLREVAGIITDTVRDTDIVARYGGEEFAVVMNCTDGDGATKLAERVRKAVADYSFRTASATTFSVSVSIGVTEFGMNDTIETLVARADKALYEAKGAGRNQVVSISENVACKN